MWSVASPKLQAVGIISGPPARPLYLHAILHSGDANLGHSGELAHPRGRRHLGHPLLRCAFDSEEGLYTLRVDGTPHRARTAAIGRGLRPVRHRLRQRGLVDLLRAWARGLLCPGADADCLRNRGLHLLSDRRDLRGGDHHVSRGRWILQLRAPRLQRVLVVLRGVGADAQLRHHDRDLRVLCSALHRGALLEPLAPFAGRRR